MEPRTTHENAEEFIRMTQRVAVKLEEVMGVLLEGGYEVKHVTGYAAGRQEAT